MENEGKRMKRSGAKFKSKLHNGEVSKKVAFICDYCQKEFSCSSRLKRHIPVHTGQKDYRCHFCYYSASQKSSLDDHIRRHLKERNFKCTEPNCEASFVSSSELKQHKLNHNKLKKFPCTFCPYKTNTKASLTTHMNFIHSELKPFKCPQENCEYSAKQKSNLNQHLKTHSEEKNQICPHQNCGFKTKWSVVLKRHLETHSNGQKRFKCHFCEYSCHRHGDLVVHVRVHTGETPFACQLCPYKTKNNNHLTRHMKTHAE